MTNDPNRLRLVELAKLCRDIVHRARAAGVHVSDGMRLDLCADQLPTVPLDTLRAALVVAGPSQPEREVKPMLPSHAYHPTWYVKPRDQGQAVLVAWAACGEPGAICRVTYPGAPPTYRLHKWLVDGDFAPWNGHTGARKRGRRITAAQAEALLAEFEGGAD